MKLPLDVYLLVINNATQDPLMIKQRKERFFASLNIKSRHRHSEIMQRTNREEIGASLKLG